MAEMKLKRPTKEMMLAVNAAIDGKQTDADRLVTEHKLSRKELQARLEKRAGEKYDLEKGRGPRKANGIGTAKAPSGDMASIIDVRTKIVTLLHLESKVQELLAQKNKSEVTKVRDAVKNVGKLRKQLEDAEALIG